MLYLFINRRCNVCGCHFIDPVKYDQRTDTVGKVRYQCGRCRTWAGMVLLTTHLDLNIKRKEA